MEAHLRSDLVEGLRQEVGASHPRFEGAEGVLDGLPADAHGVGHVIEPDLHLVHDAFVLPALEPLELVGRAFRFEGAGEAGRQVTVFVHIVLAIGSGAAAGQLFACGAGVVIALRVEDEVMTRKEAALGCAGGTPVIARPGPLHYQDATAGWNYTIGRGQMGQCTGGGG